MIEKIAALECLGEVEGFEDQIRKDGRSLDENERAALALHKIRLAQKIAAAAPSGKTKR
jgi:hypothetical protein